MPSLPQIAIVGRPNVGKSSLLNALVGKRISIVQDMPGVTRDRVTMPLRVGEKFVELIDTGGYGFVDPDALTEHIKHQIDIAVNQAKLVLFVVDSTDGRTSADEQIASMLRRRNVKTVLVANKADSSKVDPVLGDFARLGLGTPIGVSATTDRNLDLVVDAIARNVDLSDAPTIVPDPDMHVAIVGKRNAGKSTLVNAIAEIYEGHGDRVIVSEVPGTTRDSVDVRFEKEGKNLVVIDTAGVRKKRHMVTNDIEFYSFHRAQRSIRRADVVLMLIDATEPVSEPDKKLAQYINEQFKPVVLVINKWDLAKAALQEQSREQGGKFDDHGIVEEYRKYLDAELQHLDFAPIAFITAKEGKNVQAVLDLTQHLYKQATTRVTTHKLNEIVRQILEEKRPSTASGRRARIYYVTQSDVSPPTVVLFVNNPAYFNESYHRFMINRLRETLPFKEVPIKLVVRERQRQGPIASIDDADVNKPPSARPRKPPARPTARGGRARLRGGGSRSKGGRADK